MVQLEELLEVRHSVFVVGNAGTGKTEVWKTLFKTYQNIKRKPMYNDLNPKAVTNDELFGVINPATREWKDGNLNLLCSKIVETCKKYILMLLFHIIKITQLCSYFCAKVYFLL